jgi:hypothetical protein
MLAFKKSEDKDGWDLAIVNFQKARAPFLDVCIQIQDVALTPTPLHLVHF